MRLLPLLLLFVATTLFAEPNFRTFSASGIRSCSLSYADEPEFRVCLSGRASQDDYERALVWSTESIFAWFKVFKQMDENVTRTITYTCDRPHLTWHLRNGNGRSYASPRSINIFLRSPYGTWTHELGHAMVGLGDTYSGSAAGNCQRGQPQSLMCWGGYGPRADHQEHSTLWEDDVAGAQYTYPIANGSTTPPDFADQIDVFAAVNVLMPWPESPIVNVNEDELNVTVDHQLPATEISYDVDAVSCGGFSLEKVQ